MKRIRFPQSRSQFGVARGDVTPPVGVYHRMWGAATHERATGIHRPLTATAAYFRPLDSVAECEKILIAVDHCLLWGREQTRLLEGLARRTSISPESVVIAYSHTHAAGLIDLSRRDRPGGELLDSYLDRLEGVLANLIDQARDNARPAEIAYGTARCDLAAHRDYYDLDQSMYVCGFNPEGVADDLVVVARAVSDSGANLATIVNYACHPTTLAWKNSLISPDYPGAMREVVESVTGVPCIFLQGASADLGPREGFSGDPRVADSNGRRLGHAALSGILGLAPAGMQFEYVGPVVSGATLGVWEWRPIAADRQPVPELFETVNLTIPLAYRPELPTVGRVESERADWLARKQSAERAGDELAARDSHAMIERMDRQLTRLAVLPEGKDFPFPVRLWRMGDAVWVLVEGELSQVFQQELRRRIPGMTLVIVTLANGSRCTYLPAADSYGKGIYQETIALLARGCLEKLLEEITLAILRLTR